MYYKLEFEFVSRQYISLGFKIFMLCVGSSLLISAKYKFCQTIAILHYII